MIVFEALGVFLLIVRLWSLRERIEKAMNSTKAAHTTLVVQRKAKRVSVKYRFSSGIAAVVRMATLYVATHQQ